jgi:hypothetical protein
MKQGGETAMRSQITIQTGLPRHFVARNDKGREAWVAASRCSKSSESQSPLPT